MPLNETAVDSIRVSRATGERLVSLRDRESCRCLPILLGSVEREALVQALGGEQPNTYALLSDAINALSAKVKMVVIDSWAEAKATLTVADRSVDVNCRASDAIGIAVASKSPIFVEESVMEVYGLPMEASDREGTDTEPSQQSESETAPQRLTQSTEAVRVLNPQELTSTRGVVEVKVTYASPSLLNRVSTVILSDREGYVTAIWVTSTVADAISRVMRNDSFPDTYGLLCRIAHVFSSRVSMALIEEPTAQLVLESAETYFGIQCKSSDAILAALVAKAPIYADGSLLMKHGKPRPHREGKPQGSRTGDPLLGKTRSPRRRFWFNKE